MPRSLGFVFFGDVILNPRCLPSSIAFFGGYLQVLPWIHFLKTKLGGKYDTVKVKKLLFNL